MTIYRTKGVCAKEIGVELDGQYVRKVMIKGGCHGQGQALARLVEGMEAEAVIDKLYGTPCRKPKDANKWTSCADQLARAIEQELERSTYEKDTDTVQT